MIEPTMTVGKLKEWLNAFSNDTPIVVGSPHGPRVHNPKPNTYYPSHLEETVWVVIDPKVEDCE